MALFFIIAQDILVAQERPKKEIDIQKQLAYNSLH